MLLKTCCLCVTLCGVFFREGFWWQVKPLLWQCDLLCSELTLPPPDRDHGPKHHPSSTTYIQPVGLGSLNILTTENHQGSGYWYLSAPLRILVYEYIEREGVCRLLEKQVSERFIFYFLLLLFFSSFLLDSSPSSKSRHYLSSSPISLAFSCRFIVHRSSEAEWVMSLGRGTRKERAVCACACVRVCVSEVVWRFGGPEQAGFLFNCLLVVFLFLSLPSFLPLVLSSLLPSSSSSFSGRDWHTNHEESECFSHSCLQPFPWMA